MDKDLPEWLQGTWYGMAEDNEHENTYEISKSMILATEWNPITSSYFTGDFLALIDSSIGDYLDSQRNTTTDAMHIVNLTYKNNGYTLSIQLSFAKQSDGTVLMSMLITAPEGAQTQSIKLYKK